MNNMEKLATLVMYFIGGFIGGLVISQVILFLLTKLYDKWNRN